MFPLALFSLFHQTLLHTSISLMSFLIFLQIVFITSRQAIEYQVFTILPFEREHLKGSYTWAVQVRYNLPRSSWRPITILWFSSQFGKPPRNSLLYLYTSHSVALISSRLKQVLLEVRCYMKFLDYPYSHKVSKDHTHRSCLSCMLPLIISLCW